MKTLLKKCIPKSLLLFYHKTLVILAALFYNSPSKKMIVIGVTGTTGKTTICNLIAKILEQADFQVGLMTTANFKIGNKEWINDTKQTMQGRFELQKLLSEMVKTECKYAIIETSSEGIAQFRHIGIDYDIAVFTGITPEHIESHGSFENYRKAKEELFKSLSEKENKVLNNKIIKKISVVNLDDENVKYFLQYNVDEKYGYRMITERQNKEVFNGINIIEASNAILSPINTTFILKKDNNKEQINLKLLGQFNIYNALAAICVVLSQNISLDIIKKALVEVKQMPGRLELIDEGQNFTVVVDYAHEPRGLEEIYKTIKLFKPNKVISVLGSQGGGRDKRKRPILGKLAAEYTDVVIVTNEDPYDENPKNIIKEVIDGALLAGKKLGENCFNILDRKEAVEFAIKKAQKGDLVVITGKGCEQCIVTKNNKKIPWDDRKVVRKILHEARIMNYES